MSDEIHNLNLDEVGYDLDFFPRTHIDMDETVCRYTEALVADVAFDFEPIVVMRTNGRRYRFLTLDGVHRLISYNQADRQTIPARIETLPESQWFARSVELNAKHGRPLAQQDRAIIVQRLERDGWNIEKISDLLKVRVELLSPLRSNGKSIQAITAHKRVTTGQFVGVPASGRGSSTPRVPWRQRTVPTSQSVASLSPPIIDEPETFGPPEPTPVEQSSSDIKTRVIEACERMLSLIACGDVDVNDPEVKERITELHLDTAKLLEGPDE